MLYIRKWNILNELFIALKECLPLHETNKNVLSLPEGGKILFQNLFKEMLSTEYEEGEKGTEITRRNSMWALSQQDRISSLLLNIQIK